MQSSIFSAARRRLPWLASAALALAGMVGCHHNQLNSGYGIGFVTLTGDGDTTYVRYVVNVDSVVLTGATVGPVTVVSVPETVDFTKLKDISELWSSAAIPNDTYVSAAITLDYTSASIAVLVNGVPQTVTVHDTTGAVPTTMTVTSTFDPNKKFVINPTLLSSDAKRLAFNYDMPLSNRVDTTVSPPVLTVSPYVTASTSAADQKLVRVRGALVNTNVDFMTYSVYIRPFSDLLYTTGTLTMFSDASTIFTINGTGYVGQAGIQQLTQTSSGSTLIAALTRYQPTGTSSPVVFAAKFEPVYVVAGSTLEDAYTVGIEGEVVARTGNSITLRNSTLVYPSSVIFHNDVDAILQVGPLTIVTADNVVSQAGLNYNSIAVGQHIIARGIWTATSPAYDTTTKVYTVDATSAQAVNTGSVRLINTQLYGTVGALTATGYTLNLQNIGAFPASAYNFAGNGTSSATDSQAANYNVNTAAVTPAPTAAAGDSVWINGLMAPFGSAPPDFNATAVASEAGEPATLLVRWPGTGTTTPFVNIDNTSITPNLSAANYFQINIGPEAISIGQLPAIPTIVPAATPAPPGDGTPDIYLPLFSLGSTANGVASFNTYSTFVTSVQAAAATPVLQMSARGTFNRATNTFTAAVINVFN